MQHSISPWKGKLQLFRRQFCLFMCSDQSSVYTRIIYMYAFQNRQCYLIYKRQIGVCSKINACIEYSYISFSSCFLMNSAVCAVTLSTLLQRRRTGTFFLTTLAFVRISYKYLHARGIMRCKIQLSDIQCKLTTANVKYKQRMISTLKQDGSLVKIPRNPPQTPRQLLGAGTHLVSAEDESALGHQQREQASIFLSAAKPKQVVCNVKFHSRMKEFSKSITKKND